MSQTKIDERIIMFTDYYVLNIKDIFDVISNDKTIMGR